MSPLFFHFNRILNATQNGIFKRCHEEDNGIK